MARKRMYIVIRNGEQVGWHETREGADADINRQTAEDVRLAHQGWITVRQMELTRYYIEVH